MKWRNNKKWIKIIGYSVGTGDARPSIYANDGDVFHFWIKEKIEIIMKEKSEDEVVVLFLPNETHNKEIE